MFLFFNSKFTRITLSHDVGLSAIYLAFRYLGLGRLSIDNRLVVDGRRQTMLPVIGTRGPTSAVTMIQN